MVGIKRLLNLLSYAAVLLGIAPLYLYLDPAAQVALPASLAASVYADRRPRFALHAGAATLLSFACFLLYAFQISLDHMVEPAVNILALLLAVRLATEKSGRNYLQIIVLSVFALASSSLLTLSVAFFFYLVLLVIVVTLALVLLSFYSAKEDLILNSRQAASLFGVALILPAVSLVLMLFFFFILPRTQHPLWNFLNPTDTATAVAGVTEKVDPGSVASIAAVKATAFRAESERLAPDELYWRGVVLNTPRGNTWIRQPLPGPDREKIVGGRPVIQTVYPEPREERYLFALDPPISLNGVRIEEFGDLTFKSRRPLNHRIKYVARSAAGGTIEAVEAVDRDFYLRVPPAVSVRVRQAAESIAAEAASAEEKIGRLEEFFTGQGLSYAETDLPGSEDPVDEFLFEKKRGYCEFFASSFALMLRIAGVPSRLVGGYYGGEYNELGGYYAVTEDTAHVWVEALAGDRWVRIDPSRLARNAEASLLSPRRRGLNIGRRLSDAIDYYWTRAVISYDLGRQLQLLRQTNLKLRRLKAPADLKRGLAILAALLTLAAALFLFLRFRRGTLEERLLRKLLLKVRKRYGVEELPPSMGLKELARRLDDPACREFAEIHGRAVYRDRGLSKEEIGRLRKLIGEMGEKRRSG